MKKINLIVIAVFCQILFSCEKNLNNQIQVTEKTDKKKSVLDDSPRPILYRSEDLIIRKISNYIYEHTTFLVTNDFEKISCNGMIVIDNNEAVIFDTPTNDQNSKELIQYLTRELNCSISAIVVTNFHADCIGGLQGFHREGVISYASNQTIKLTEKNKSNVPQQGFDKQLTLNVGNKKVYLEYLGKGYTSDNIIGYFPDDKVLFGGGLIKEVGAAEGDLEDANTKVWSETIREIKLKYPQVKIVIPGQGELGGPELLDYTMNLFKK